MRTPSVKKSPVPDLVVDIALESWQSSGKQSSFTVTGDSMRPFLLSGDILLINHDWKDSCPGDLLAYRLGSRLVVHRLFRIEHDGTERLLYLKGDNRIRHDAPVKASQVVGRVFAVKRGNKIFHPNQQTRWIVSQVFVLIALFSFPCERIAIKIKQTWFPDVRTSHANKVLKLMLTIITAPGRLLSYLVWKLSR
jgi:signal peptidase I